MISASRNCLANGRSPAFLTRIAMVLRTPNSGCRATAHGRHNSRRTLRRPVMRLANTFFLVLETNSASKIGAVGPTRLMMTQGTGMQRSLRALRILGLFVAAFCADVAACEPVATTSVRFTDPKTQTWEIGIEITATDGPAFGIVATAPVPDSWPEQKVKVIGQEKTANVRRLSFRNLGGGARQMVVSIPRLAAGESSKAVITFQVTRSSVVGPSDIEGLQLGKGLDRETRAYLAPSPKIESSDASIIKLAKEITAGKESPWQQAQAIFAWVRANMKYLEGSSLKGAVAALRDGNGDCEDFASLFIACCRASKIPARTVWVPGHCYCEFYLQNETGEGVWIPCDATRDYPFGSVSEPRMILQKGDNIFIPEYRRRFRYARPTLQTTNRTSPTRTDILRQVD